MEVSFLSQTKLSKIARSPASLQNFILSYLSSMRVGLKSSIQYIVYLSVWVTFMFKIFETLIVINRGVLALNIEPDKQLSTTLANFCNAKN